MIKKLFILKMLLISAITFAFAQQPHNGSGADTPKEGVVSGIIYDSELNKPVEYASIALFSKRDSSLVTGTVTDKTGKFTLSGLPYGMFYLDAKFIGYELKRIEDIRISPRDKKVELGKVNIEMAANQINEVNVTEDKLYVDYKIDRKVVNVSQHVNASGGTAVDVLENIPSIQTDIDGNVTLRGSSNYKVLIDGKPSILDGNDALQQLPANSIETIEIITNPSAKFDPDGTAGIINVIMKKQKKSGFNGIVNLNAGTDPSYGGNVLLNYRTNKYNLMAGYDLRNGERNGSMDSERRTTANDTTLYMLSSGDRGGGRERMHLKAGIDYYLTDKTTISLAGEYGTFGFWRGSDLQYSEYNEPNTFSSYYVSESKMDIKRKSIEGNMYLQHKFGQTGHELNISAIYSNSTGDDEDHLNESITDEFFNIIEENAYMQRTTEEGDEFDIRIKADYTKPLKNNGRFEAGLQSRIERETENYIFYNYDQENSLWIEDAERNNELESREDIHAAYTTLSSSIAGFDYQLGLRAEYTNRSIYQVMLDEEYPVKRFDLFPSVHISRKMRYDQQMQVSYSRRINRPRSWYLNPFPSYSDQKNIRVGNPELEPEYMDSYEINYQKRIKKSFFTVEAFYRKKSNMIERISTVDENDPNIMKHTFANLEGDKSIGVELMANLSIKKWWTLNLSGSGFKYIISGNLLDEEVNQTTNTWNARMNSTFKLKTGTRFQLMGMYVAPSVTAQGERDHFLMASAAVRHDFFNNKLSTTLTVRDPFQWMEHSFTSSGSNFYMYNHFTRKSPTFRLSISYKINNYKPDRKQRNGDDGGMDFEMDEGM